MTELHDHFYDTSYVDNRFSECTRCGVLIDWEDDDDGSGGGESSPRVVSAEDVVVSRRKYRLGLAARSGDSALFVSCPHCGAGPGDYCRNPRGFVVPNHRVRGV